MSHEKEESTNEVAEIRCDLDDIEALLRSVRGDAQRLLELDSSPSSSGKSKKVIRTLNEDEKRQRAKSAWARSQVPSGAGLAKLVKKTNLAVESSDDVDIRRAEATTKERAPAFSFGHKPTPKSPDIFQVPDERPLPGPTTYNVKDNGLSTRKRPHSAPFSKSKRMPAFETPATTTPAQSQEQHPETNEGDIGTEDMDVDVVIYEYDVPIASAPSFPKAERFPQPKVKPEVLASQANQAAVNIDKAEKFIRPNVATAVMTKPSAKSEKIQLVQKAKERELQDQAAKLKDKTNNNPNPDLLSNRFKSPAVMLHPPPKAVDKTEITGVAVLDIPGPGYYEVDAKALQHVKKGIGIVKGTIIHKEATKLFDDDIKNGLLLRKKDEEAFLEANRGPGRYLVDDERSIKVPLYRKSEEKTNDKLARKRYFEQKALDMREAHDGLLLADSDVLRRRVPVASFGPQHAQKQKQKQIDSDNTEEDSRTSKIKLLHDIDKMLADQHQVVDYAVKYDYVEKRAVSMVAMKSELQARQSTQQRLQSKPEVLKVMSEKQQGVNAVKKFYGPQLPVAWVKDKDSLATKLGHQRADSDSDEDSVTEGVLALLQGTRDGDGQDMDNGELTQAYLRSSYSGSRYKAKAVVQLDKQLDEDRHGGVKKLTELEKDFDFIGPQVQLDWTSLAEGRHRKPIVELDKLRGRDLIKVHSKGVVEVQAFDDHKVRKDEHALGPGHYDVMSQVEMAKARAKGMIDFDKIVAREDVVGAHGEKPISAQTRYEEDGVVVDVEGQVLDIDYGNAKDQAKGRLKDRGIKLYDKDRYPKEVQKDPAEVEHLGGSWFEGMFDEAKKKMNNAVDFSKMKGRPDVEKEQEDKLMEEEYGANPEKAIDLEIKDFQPHKVDPSAKTTEFKDPKKYPRFVEAKKDIKAADAPPSPEPKFAQIGDKPSAMIDMSKMRGRKDISEGKEESEQVQDLVFGKISDEAMKAGAEARINNIMQGQDKLLKRPLTGIDFDKQRGRKDLESNRDKDADIIAEDMGEAGKLFTDIPGNNVHKSALEGKGVLQWDKVRGREDDHGKEDELKAVEDGAWLLNKQELDLQPKKEGTSGFKKLKEGVAWDKRTARHQDQDDSVLQKDSVLGPRMAKDGEILDLQPADAGKVKKGMQGFGEVKEGTGYNMGNQKGRSVVEKLDLAKELGLEEDPEVIIAPSDDKLKVRTKASTTMKSTASRFPDSGPANVNKAMNNEALFGKQPEVLDIEPEIDAVRRKRAGYTSMSNQTFRTSTTQEEKVLKGLSMEREELKLDPKDDMIRKSSSNQMSALRTSAARIPTIYELHVEDDARKEKVVLDLDTKDDAVKNRVVGGSTLRASASRIPTAKEVQAEEAFRKENQVELDLNADVTVARASGPRASSLGNKASRGTAALVSEQKAETELQKEQITSNAARRRTKSKETLKPSSSSAKILKTSSIASSTTSAAKPKPAPAANKPSKKTAAPPSTFSPPTITAPTVSGKAPEPKSFNMDAFKKGLADIGLK